VIELKTQMRASRSETVYEKPAMQQEKKSSSKERKWSWVCWLKLRTVKATFIKFNYARSILGLFVDVVVQQFDDQVDVGQDHSAAAVAFAPQLVECLTGNV